MAFGELVDELLLASDSSWFRFPEFDGCVLDESIVHTECPEMMDSILPSVELPSLFSFFLFFVSFAIFFGLVPVSLWVPMALTHLATFLFTIFYRKEAVGGISAEESDRAFLCCSGVSQIISTQDSASGVLCLAIRSKMN